MGSDEGLKVSAELSLRTLAKIQGYIAPVKELTGRSHIHNNIHNISFWILVFIMDLRPKRMLK